MTSFFALALASALVGCSTPMVAGELRETLLIDPVNISAGHGGLLPGAVIVAPDTGPALILESGARLRGVTVRGRDRSGHGAAVVVRGRDVVLAECIFEGDATTGVMVLGGDLEWRGGGLRPGSGVGVMARGGRVRLESVVLEGSRQAGFEAQEGAVAELKDATIRGNGGDGVIVGALAHFSMRRGAIEDNGGAAVRVLFPRTPVQLEHVIVRRNVGGGLVDEGAETPTLAPPPPAMDAPEAPVEGLALDTRLVPERMLAEALAAIDFVETELALPYDRFEPLLSPIRAGLATPAQSPDRVVELAERLQAADSPQRTVIVAADVLRMESASVSGRAPNGFDRGGEDDLVSVLLAIRALVDPWPDASALRQALFDESPEPTLLEAHWSAPDERAATARLGADARSVDPDVVAALLAALARAASPAAFTVARASASAPPRSARQPRVTGRHTAFWTEAGWFVIGESEANTYGPGWTAILDRGGDDLYEDAAFAENGGSVVVDLAGDDLYRGRTASASRGIALLWDHAGHDRYSGGEATQAVAFAGGALLWDQAGSDRYEAVRGSQGVAVGGMALLVDRAGDDHYEAGSQSQAYAGAGGFAAIVDHAGDDRYTLTGGGADTLRNPAARLSFGQGFATGFRPGASGGIAILSDGDGSDRYDASLFAQGCGYWGALGALVDGGGGDVYLGWQYVQGSGVHGAVGVLVDRGQGRDFYQAWTSAQGAGHDLALGVLVDEGGNDLYRSDNLTQGSGNANGTGILVDGGGEDVYMLEQSTLGQGHGIYENLSRRWGSLGILLDRGGKDRYSGPGRDASTWTQGEIGVGLDR